MSFFKKIFGSKREEFKRISNDSDSKSETIKTYDGYGREIQVSREDWRKKVLPNSLKKEWDKPDELD